MNQTAARRRGRTRAAYTREHINENIERKVLAGQWAAPKDILCHTSFDELINLVLSNDGVVRSDASLT